MWEQQCLNGFNFIDVWGRRNVFKRRQKEITWPANSPGGKRSKLFVEVIWLKIHPLSIFSFPDYSGEGWFPEDKWGTVHRERAALPGRQSEHMYLAQTTYSEPCMSFFVQHLTNEKEERNLVLYVHHTFKSLKCKRNTGVNSTEFGSWGSITYIEVS